MQIDAQDLNAVAALDEAAAKKSNSSIIAIAVGGTMLAVGAGLGYLFGTRKGVKKGEEAMKTGMQEEMTILRNTVDELKQSAKPM